MLVEGSEFQYEIGKGLVEWQAYIQKDRFEYPGKIMYTFIGK